jgi:hypothetical protein
MSVTMQPRNLAFVPELLLPLLLLLLGLAHPVAITATTLSAAAALIIPLTNYLQFQAHVAA